MKDTRLQPGTLTPCSQVPVSKPPGVQDLTHVRAVSASADSQPPLLTYIHSEEIQYLGSIFSFFLRQDIM